MADVITTTDLANWPGVVLRSTATNALVVGIVNGLITDIVERDEYPTWVRALALNAAARSLANPENFSSVTRAMDDWKTTVRYRDSDEGFNPDDVGVYLTDSEEARLRRLVTNKRAPNIGSIRLRIPG